MALAQYDIAVPARWRIVLRDKSNTAVSSALTHAHAASIMHVYFRRPAFLTDVSCSYLLVPVLNQVCSRCFAQGMYMHSSSDLLNCSAQFYTEAGHARATVRRLFSIPATGMYLSMQLSRPRLHGVAVGGGARGMVSAHVESRAIAHSRQENSASAASLQPILGILQGQLVMSCPSTRRGQKCHGYFHLIPMMGPPILRTSHCSNPTPTTMWQFQFNVPISFPYDPRL